jgi:hypothetical protein
MTDADQRSCLDVKEWRGGLGLALGFWFRYLVRLIPLIHKRGCSICHIVPLAVNTSSQHHACIHASTHALTVRSLKFKVKLTLDGWCALPVISVLVS